MTVTLSTLGTLDLRTSDGVEIRRVLAQPKRFALLVFLALEAPTTFKRRDSILPIFWAEEREELARNALCQGLSYLRRHLPGGAVLARNGTEVAIEKDLFQVDVDEFSLALRDGRGADALGIYRGDFLRGFHLRGPAGFDHWVSNKRDLLRMQASEAAWTLAEEQAMRGAVREALRTGHRGLELSGPDEERVVDLLETLAKVGDRTGAVMFFERFRDRLLRDLEMEPSHDTLQMVDRIRRGALPAPQSPQTA